MGAYLSKMGGVGIQVGCRWFWGFKGVWDIEGGCTVVFDGVWGVKVVWVRFLMGFGVSKMVGVWI